MLHDIRSTRVKSADPVVVPVISPVAVHPQHPDGTVQASIQELKVTPPSILVVDDEAQIVDLLCLLLEDEGFRVHRAYDGFQAWRQVQDHNPDLVISDVMMPGFTGIELARRVRQQASDAPPVILMSAVTHMQTPEGIPFLAKPFDINHLLDLVIELADRPQVGTQSARP